MDPDGGDEDMIEDDREEIERFWDEFLKMENEITSGKKKVKTLQQEGEILIKSLKNMAFMVMFYRAKQPERGYDLVPSTHLSEFVEVRDSGIINKEDLNEAIRESYHHSVFSVEGDWRRHVKD